MTHDAATERTMPQCLLVVGLAHVRFYNLPVNTAN